ncbi:MULTISPECIES: type III-A CRISPR-associated RAMP protein Csm3 [unclassified Thermotoga]|uniref:type III-A CRISPR-associated RAMP protein Csm3 n=1 Tax=unclassified Thermotoga TaxID=2631113 RepID=UPI000280E7DC|nr:MULTISPECIES: type III-A CRISPR-associated RAMP protein Csm3 [unclassified Thermotoga]AIY86565.1 CRISPR-associated RAMP Csm3 family protein [Thermotoga sp. 2812B]AIY88330.1 CRISPR-associated RAMP Csm3 family protein [Thermotoga sp. Cell2]EJX26006.1 CRISPR-associated RAMP Csm3 family protein [Thermotoga sp. EMP]KAF2960729.1 type III-A CRISPR-associated RAMP protein Csm3 [Thermotoga sp. 38H-to]KHC92271.1 CRISPR-associated RAMP Csm3 family protein [Thermotoga sp. Mc24]
MERPILGKYIIKGKIILETGLRIGGQELGVNIGGIDNPVIRNPLTGEPYIPGSSVKGKMRSLMERLLNLDISGNKVRRHECEDKECKVCRVFGSTSTSKNGNNIPSRLLVRDAFLTEDSKTKLLSMETDLPYTEWKTENALDRVTCKADPRSFERIPAGAEFEFEIIYTAENEKHIKEDLENIATALELLEDDYLGGNGSRGYGKVKFSIEKVIFKSADYYKGEGTPVEKEVKGGVEGFKKAIPEIVKG